MENEAVDERYPSIYQRGGGGRSHPVQGPDSAPAHVDVIAEGGQANVVEMPVDQQMVDSPDSLAETVSPAADASWPARYPIALAALGLVTLAVGTFFLTAQYLVPSSLVAGTPDGFGVQAEAWGMVTYYLAPSILTAGLGLICCLLLVASRQSSSAERWFRRGLWTLAGVLIAAGFWVLFVDVWFPEVNVAYGQDYAKGPVAQSWTQTVRILCYVLLVPGLASAAALGVLPPSWARRPPEFDEDAVPDTAGSSGRISSGRGAPSARAAWLLGGLLVGLGMVFGFATRIFPLSLASDTSAGGQTAVLMSQWPILVSYAAPAFMLVGLGVVAWGVFVWALSGRRLAK